MLFHNISVFIIILGQINAALVNLRNYLKTKDKKLPVSVHKSLIFNNLQM